MSDFVSSGAGPTGSPAPAPTSAPSGPTPSAAESPSFGGSPSAAAPESTYEVKINGQVQKVPLSELLNGYSRHSDYTRKAQELSQRERLYQGQITQYEAALQEIKGFLEDKARVEQFLKESFQNQVDPSADPESPLTAAQAEQMLQTRLTAAQREQQQQLALIQHRMEVQHLTGQYTPQVDNKIKELKTRFPELNSPRTERMLRMEVLNRQPQSLEQAIQIMETVAQEIVGDLGNIFKMRGAAGTANSPSPLSNGIEPRGGVSPMPGAQPNFKSVKDPALRELIMRDLIGKTQG